MGSSHEFADPVQAGASAGARNPAEQPGQPADLRSGLTGGLGDRAEGRCGAVVVGAGQALPSTGLHDHDAHAVSDDVVQFSGDPRAFVADRLQCEPFPFRRMRHDWGWAPS